MNEFTVYIAGPMTGYEYFNYPAFRAAEAELKARGFSVLCPVDSEQHNDTGKPQKWDWYMRHAIRMVLDSGAICLLPGWEHSPGAQLELRIAKALGLVVRELDEWMAFAAVPEGAQPLPADVRAAAETLIEGAKRA